MPTLAPGRTLVPRWRMRTLPAVTRSPANAFTPSRLLLLSRPLRDEPMPFLCAIAFLHLCQRNLVDAKLGEVLPVSLLPPVVRLRLVLEDDHLLPASMAEHGRVHRRSGDVRCADGHPRAISDQEHAVQGHGRTRFGPQGFHLEGRPFFDAILFPAIFNDCVHLPALTFRSSVRCDQEILPHQLPPSNRRSRASSPFPW